MVQNKTFVYKSVPQELPVPGDNIVVEDRPIDLEAPLAPGGLLLQVLSASLDPYLRGRMRDPRTKSYAPPLQPDEAIPNGVMAKVLRSDSADFAEGDLVLAYAPVAEYVAVSDPKARRVRKVENRTGVDPMHFLGALGMPGLTAWSGLHRIGQPKEGETLFVSSAAGAVGQVAGQVAKRLGLKVIGSVGSDEKLDFITKELGFDGGFNYKKESPKDALKRLAPDGIDIYFENVGGEHLEAALDAMNTYGRIIVCGMISTYNTPPEKRKGIQGLQQILTKQLKMEGYLVGQPEFGAAHSADHQEKMQQWIADGSLKATLDVTEGIDKAGEAFVSLLEGRNFGKAVVKIAS